MSDQKTTARPAAISAICAAVTGRAARAASAAEVQW